MCVRIVQQIGHFTHIKWFLEALKTVYAHVVASGLGDEALEDFARTELSEVCGSVGQHCLHALSPFYRRSELSQEVGLDFGWGC